MSHSRKIKETSMDQYVRSESNFESLTSRVFHKNLKIFTDADFSENQVPDTVFYALSIGHKIRAVRVL